MLYIIISLVLIVFLVVPITAFFVYRETNYWKKQVERSLNMVPLLLLIPRDSGSKDEQGRYRDQRDIMKEIISVAETFYVNLSVIGSGLGYGPYSVKKVKSKIRKALYGTPHLAAEIVAREKEIFFYLAVPIEFKEMVEKSISSQYPDISIEETEEHNIFNKKWGISNIVGGEFWGSNSYYYPLKTYEEMDSEPLDALTTALNKLDKEEGAAIQILFRKANSKYTKKSYQVAKGLQTGKHKQSIVSEVVGAAMVKEEKAPEGVAKMTPMEEEKVKAIERKAAKPAFETRIRVVASAGSRQRSEMILKEIQGAFVQYNTGWNRLKFYVTHNTERVVTDYIFRFFEKPIINLKINRGATTILSSEELATLFHPPNFLIETPGIRWLPSKKAAPPTFIPESGVVIGRSKYRGEEKPIRVAEEDRRRHTYIIGQTGTGKTTSMINMAISDIRAGKGICYIDPHGQDLQEHILPYIPKERAEDVIYFDATDLERPMGLNLFTARTPEEKDFVIQESIAMLYRLYDPGHTGIMGPRFEHWFRNAALALMADPRGGTFIDVPRIFTDDKFLAEKLRYVTDPVVRNFWINEMGQTSDFHKSEVLGWFVGKFGAFMTNTTMRNIIGQTESSFSFRTAMDNNKIVLVNLSKGQVGELNMQLLGMILVAKVQMAAMSRADVPEAERKDFYLYVDEFQNFSTDSFASILSEARKFKLNLIVGNQFIGQLQDPIRDAVFGNVGNLISFRVGNEDAEYLSKQFEPVFNAQDLINLENYNSIAKILINSTPTRPFSMQGYPYPEGANTQIAEAIRDLSRLKYGRARETVDAEIQARMAINTNTNTTNGQNQPQQ
jgi:hypothetical protein